MSLRDKVMEKWAPSYGFLEAARILVSQNRHNESDILSVPIYLLAGFQIELLLKAYLTAVGATDKDLKDIGHDLDAAYNAAVAKGLKSSLPISDIIAKMSDPHKKLAFRYFDGAELDLHTPETLIPMLQAWDREVQDAIDHLCPTDSQPRPTS
jgi:hypothetical protein